MDVPRNLWITTMVVLVCVCTANSRMVKIDAGETDAFDDDASIDKLARQAKNNKHHSHKEKQDSSFEQEGELPYPGYQIHYPIEGQSQDEGHWNKVKVHTVHHKPDHTQQEKVKAVQDAADIVEPKKVHDLPNPEPIKQNPGEKTKHHIENPSSIADIYFLAVVAGCSVAGLVGLVVAGVCWYRLQKNVKAASEAEYPAYGVTGPTKERVGSPGDRKLAQSAQMYHYQHQKQQMIALEKANGDMKHDGSDEDSEEENEEGDYTVYECPGLAPTGEMEVKNPLFSEETPVTPTPNGADPK